MTEARVTPANKSRSPSRLSSKKMSVQDILSLENEKDIMKAINNTVIFDPSRVYQGYGSMVNQKAKVHIDLTNQLNLKLKIKNKDSVKVIP